MPSFNASTYRHPSPLGDLLLLSDGRALTGLLLDGEEPPAGADHTPPEEPEVVRAARQQLDEYFAGTRRRFELPLAPEGTPFQQRVWVALQAIPAGETRSYREIAEAIGSPRGVRAVGAANARNPLPIVIPCHRVIASDGSLGGYSGGVERKAFLLALEGAGGRYP